MGWRSAAGSDGDASAGQNGARVGIVGRAGLGVIDDDTRGAVPDLYSEPVGAGTAECLPVDGGNQEAVATRSVDAPRAAELRFLPGDYEPVIARALELESCCLQPESRVRDGLGRILPIPRQETERRAAGRCLV